MEKLGVRGEAVMEGNVRLHKSLTVGSAPDPSLPSQPPSNVFLHHSDLTLDHGRLVVQGGYGDFGSRQTNSYLGGIRLPTTKQPGSACNTTGSDPARYGGNLALYYTGTSVQVMVCRPMAGHAMRQNSTPFDYPGIWTLPGDSRPDAVVGGGMHGRLPGL
ncbi:hypothetical protein [Roseateles chitinivorans]|uniref:hypothetical protein n=1 Tax=Roseateles chitinivorans TaxID=2917965 RepID=UPI003D6763C6